MKTPRFLRLLSLLWIAIACANGSAEEARGPRSRAEAAQSTQKMTWRPVSMNGKSVDSSAETTDEPDDIDSVSFEYEEYSPAYGEPVYGDQGCGAEIACGAEVACDGGFTHPPVCGFWVRAEYLLWALDGIDLPPLVTTSPDGTLPEDTGVLGQTGTIISYGNESILDSMRSGLRVTLGWADDSCGNGFEMSGMGIFEDDESFQSNADLLARPVFDTDSGSETSMLIAHPDFLSGSVNVRASNQLASFDVSRRQLLSSRACQSLSLLFGYRYGNLEEMLRVEQSSVYTAAQGQIISGTTVDLFDDFQTKNQFHGAQLGLHYKQWSAHTTLDTYAKVGLGINHGETTIAGQTVNTVPGGGSATFEGGLLAQTTNIGVYDDTSFMALPEIGLNLTTQVQHNMKLTIGYSMMYWSDAARLDDAISRNVSQFPPETPTGTREPAYEYRTSSFLAHGLNIGAAFTF
ncbi:BBP7 family outer membrane beta-barrel protein [Aporhodopirellula aestuarii]|uniref:BBP7 family outer membrane beta-barrel protein n=1 Tax=Aporhodopirellula aestuarii TaxID=2950107 RepID=A0ABT0TZH3_9BACT|nr:BBP7 family outer membrane beta-barrel protein [Aporhodopirellula aestuarii]MCM2369951.1 BBP7 family outer membrane beta-barrel protein [Aporhodopirellula aestuarii]